MEPTVLLYDSHCGVCRWSVSKALRLARRAHAYRFLARHRTRPGRLVGEQRCPSVPG